MSKGHEITRRSLLAGAPAALAATAIPATAFAATAVGDDGLCGLPLAAVHIERAVAAMAEPIVRGHWAVTIRSGDAGQYWGFRQVFNEVAAAIGKHERAAQANLDALDRLDMVEQVLSANPRYDHDPKVKYGNLIVGTKPDGTNETRPLFARDIKTLDELSESECRASLLIWGEKGAERTKARYGAHKQALRNQLRRKKRHESNAGLPQAKAEAHKTYRAEERAAIGVLLAKPANASEREQKRRYVQGRECFTADWWDAGPLLAALLAQVA